MKKFKLFSLCAFALSLLLVGCKTEEPPITPVSEDGWYISGEATSFSTLGVVNMFEATTNENGDANADGSADNPARVGLFNKYVYLTSGKTFVISKVVGGVETKYGSTDAYTYNPGGKYDQINANVTRGTLAADKTLSVSKTGLYQVAFDVNTNKVVICEITHWGVIGGATPGGWGSNQVMNLVGTLSPDSNTYKVENVILTIDQYKFRYSDGWKVQISDTASMTVGGENIKINTNYGGALNALVAGGSNISNTANGVYTLTMTWKKSTGKWTATAVKTGEYVPPTYPDNMYLVGEGTAYSWDAPATKAAAVMHKLAGGGTNEGIFWKVLFIEGGKGFKISNANWTAPNLGFADVTSYDANGVAVTDNGGNMSVATSGIYTVVLDLRNSTKKVSIMNAKVYGIGDCFGGYTADVAGNLFTTDLTAKTLISPALPAAGNIRIYVSHPWIAAWWNSEFNVYGTEIQYRNNGGDQTAVPGTAGKVITLHFDDNTGSIN
ncbi:MAG TPA: SusF/SusE family outer membrane protein [Paludibacter sp.]